mmetsp:Transcript_31498/g.90308  ORF Transcript_31498/g.90308 Transcript_31498/m.90308 type:complete len:439 (+) Transcript_31498:84-1400(+)
MEYHSELLDQDTRGWSMRRGHCRRLKHSGGRESRRGRTAFARSVNIGDGQARYSEEWSTGKSVKERMLAQEIADAIAEEAYDFASLCAAAPAVVVAPSCGKAGASRWEQAAGRAGCAAVARQPATEARPCQLQGKVSSRWEQAAATARCAAAAWQTVTEAKPCQKERRPVKEPVPSDFEAMREIFFQKHRAPLLAALQKVFTGKIELRPVSPSADVKNQFMQSCRSGHTVQPVFHGTKAANHPSICSSGLKIPTAASGVQVSNGSSHGLGIYTAKLNNPYLSRGFCSEPRMLVCAVADNAVQLAVPRPLGTFYVTAESAVVRHVGDAMVVFDPHHVAPIFEASGEGFATASSFVPRAVTPVNIASSPAPSATVRPSPVGATATVPSSESAAAAAASVKGRSASKRKVVRCPPTGLVLFLARRAVQRRLLRRSASARPK